MSDNVAAVLSPKGGSSEGEALSREDLVWLERVTYGPTSAALARYRELGRKAFLAEQLQGLDAALPCDVQTAMDEMDISQFDYAALQQQRRHATVQARALADELERVKALREIRQQGVRLTNQARQRNLLRAIYSPAQLREQMVWFWLNHFSVYSKNNWFVADYSERAIRSNALGPFRNLVLATLTHPVMLSYLNNSRNQKGRLNENYARELMELHTLGVEAGYTQQDVQALARILTGVGIDAGRVSPQSAAQAGRFVQDQGFVFDPRRHDDNDKQFLGQTITGGGFDEVERAVDVILAHPSCASFVARRLAQYFVGDEPSPDLLTLMAERFRATNGDIADMLEVLMSTPDFVAEPGRRFKDPFRFVVSTVRLTYDDRPFDDPARLVTWVQRMTHSQFGRITPDGYPLTDTTWKGSGAMSTRFDAARGLAAEASRAAVTAGALLLTNTPLYQQTLRPRLSERTLNVLSQTRSDNEATMFALASPEFNRF